MFIYYYSTKSEFNQHFRTDRLIEEGGDAIAPPPRKKNPESKAAGPAKSVATVWSRRTADEPEESEVSDKETKIPKKSKGKAKAKAKAVEPLSEHEKTDSKQGDDIQMKSPKTLSNQLQGNFFLVFIFRD